MFECLDLGWKAGGGRRCCRCPALHNTVCVRLNLSILGRKSKERPCFSWKKRRRRQETVRPRGRCLKCVPPGKLSRRLAVLSSCRLKHWRPTFTSFHRTPVILPFKDLSSRPSVWLAPGTKRATLTSACLAAQTPSIILSISVPSYPKYLKDLNKIKYICARLFDCMQLPSPFLHLAQCGQTIINPSLVPLPPPCLKTGAIRPLPALETRSAATSFPDHCLRTSE